MGYRSQVAIAIHPDKVADFLAVLSTSKETLEMCQGWGGKGIQTGIFTKGDLFIEMDDVKWYESSREVRIINDFVATTCEADDGWDLVRFIRIGEDYDDVQVCGEYASEFLCLARASIHIEEQF